MRAMIWKELRECLLIAVLGAIALGMGLAVAVWQTMRSYRSDLVDSLASEPVAFVATCGCALLAIALGARQSLFERRGDAWAFLVHRPLSRTCIFAAKAIAGIALLLLAALLPYFAVAAWIAVPGHAAQPFYWRLTAFGVAVAAMSAAYYFAALLIVMREARWYVSGLLPLAPAVAGSLVVFEGTAWTGVALAAAAIVSCLALAAWGTFLRGGALTRQPLLAKLALAASLGAGLFAVWLGVLALHRASFVPHSSAPHVEYSIDQQGRVWRWLWSESPTCQLVDDPAPGPLPSEAGRLDDSLNMALLELGARGRQDRWWSSSRCFRALQIGHTQRWFYSLVEGKVLRFEQRDPGSRRGWALAARLGPRDATPPDGGATERFAAPPVAMAGRVLAFADAAYWLGALELQRSPVQPSDDPIVGARVVVREQHPARDIVALATRTRLLLFTREGAGPPVALAALAAPYDASTDAWIRIGKLASHDSYMFLIGHGDGSQLAVEMTPAGAITRRIELEVPAGTGSTRSARDHFSLLGLLTDDLVPSPLALALIALTVYLIMHEPPLPHRHKLIHLRFMKKGTA